MAEGKKGTFGKFLGLWWIPRYMVINESGEITLFKATNNQYNIVLSVVRKINKYWYHKIFRISRYCILL